MTTRSPKIVDVAMLAGVSTATVSRALNRPDTVAEHTRKAVLDAAGRMGYRINLTARNLRRQRTGAVVVLVPNLGNPFFSMIIAGIEAVLAENGLSVLIVDTKQPKAGSEPVFEYLHNSRADGIISLDGLLPEDMLERSRSTGRSPPMVYACEWHDGDIAPSVRADNAMGSRLTIGYLADLGHTRIGHVAGPEQNVLTHARRGAAIAELNDRGLAIVPQWFFKGDFSIESGVAAARKLIGMDRRPTAVFCASDQMAFGMISELRRHGLSVPRDLSVVGFDDIEIANHFVPPLTTVRQPRHEIGERAANLLMGCIREHGTTAEGGTEVLPVELIVRESAAPHYD